MVVAGALTVPAASASAATLPAEFTPSCPTESPDGDYGGARICSGTVPSFDQAKLDVDVTQPMQDTGPRHPLIVLLHGFGNDKHEWESTADEGDGGDKYHWNNRWFAKHGYYVLNYTARLLRRRRGGRPAGHAVRPERIRGPGAPRLHPAEVTRLRDPRHAVARGADRAARVARRRWLVVLLARPVV